MSSSPQRPTQPGSLRYRLREMREAAGLTQEQLAERLGWGDRTIVVKVENGSRGIKPPEVAQWADVCDRADLTAELLDLRSREATDRRSWTTRRGKNAAALQGEWDDRVRASKMMREVATAIIPGLLQTLDYAVARFEENNRFYGKAGSAQEAAETRMGRRAVLHEPGHRFEFIIDEDALRKPACSPGAMLEQLDWLAYTTTLPRVTIAIVPTRGARLPLLARDNFTILDDEVTTEMYAGEPEFEESELPWFHKAADELLALAATGEDARRLIAEAATWWRERREGGEDVQR